MPRLAWARGYAIALAAVSIVTLVIGILESRAHVAGIAMLYLVAVLASATFAGRRAAIVASVAAFLAYNWFFVPPLHTFQVGDPEEWFALVLFLITAAITGQMASQLRDRAREAAVRAAETVHLYGERERLRERATEAEVLRRADELKTTLLGAVSHDLRTPLASIIASAGSLRQPDVEWTAAERTAFLDDIESEARRLERIVANLLDLSRMESGTLRPERGWYDIAALVDDVVGRLRGPAAGHHVNVSVAEDLPPVPLDYVEIDQVLSNLIENALRHTPAGTRIWIDAARDGDAVAVTVADDGPGIDPTSHDRLFDPFFSTKPDGTGLGLPISARIVDKHGGVLEFETQSGHGTIFRVLLPASQDQQTA